MSSSPSRHSLLLVEDSPTDAATLVAMLTPMGFACRVARTLAEVQAALAEETPCAVVQDMQIPFADGGRPDENAGEASIALVRAISRGPKRIPIFVVTAFSTDPEFVWRMAEMECDAFVPKADVGKLAGKVRAYLKKNGREEHGECGRCNGESRPDATTAKDARNEPPTAPRAAAPAHTDGVTIAIEGKVTPTRRSEIVINGQTREAKDAPFLVLLRLIAGRERSSEGWMTRAALGIGESRNAVSRVREVFKGLVPEGFEVVEGDQRGSFRLNPAVKVERVEWGVLKGHPHPGVGKVAEEKMKR